MKGNLFEALIGAAVLAVAAVFLTFAFSNSDISSVQGYEVVAKFDRVDGLNVGSDVRLSGIKVGTVLEQTLDGESYHIQAGDVVWTGVGCVHSFANESQEPVRWLETFSPQPPTEDAFRFMAQWEKRAEELEGV